MMLSGKLSKGIEAAVISVAVVLITSPSVFAAESHEDPEIAKPAFSGISLFSYYTDALDFILKKDPIAVESRLEKMPFANVPQSLEGTTEIFATSGIDIAHLVLNIDRNLGKLTALKGQFRLDEAVELSDQISDNLSQANSELNYLEKNMETTGTMLNVFSAPKTSNLRQSYNEVLDRIDKIRQMLALYEELLKSTGTTMEELLKPTSLTLEIQPAAAFVGDNIRFDGVLTSEKKPLDKREVDILLNGSQYLTASTDAGGHYRGALMVPYRYLTELNLQALYYPRDKDIGLYLASLSSVRTLKVLFYEAKLKLTVEDKVYPGRDTTVKGKFDYGQSPPLSEGKIEIYLDDVFAAKAIAQQAFAQKLTIAADTDLGKHVITVSSAAAGRYSPVVATAILNVTRATPILDIDMPRLAMIPGSFGLKGRLYSEVGPLSGASIKLGLANSQVELVSAGDGTFETKIKTGLGPGLIGSQDLAIQVIPREPWHAALATTRRILMINVVNLSGVLVLLVILGVYLPGRLRKRLGVYPRAAKPAVVGGPAELAPTYSERVIIPATQERAEASGEPRDRIFYWYRQAARILGKLAKVLLAPQQTLREFARENSSLFGPLAKYFAELTRSVERLLYSQYRATERDVENSKELARTIEEGLTK